MQCFRCLRRARGPGLSYSGRLGLSNSDRPTLLVSCIASPPPYALERLSLTGLENILVQSGCEACPAYLCLSIELDWAFPRRLSLS